MWDLSVELYGQLNEVKKGRDQIVVSVLQRVN